MPAALSHSEPRVIAAAGVVVAAENATRSNNHENRALSWRRTISEGGWKRGTEGQRVARVQSIRDARVTCFQSKKASVLACELARVCVYKDWGEAGPGSRKGDKWLGDKCVSCVSRKSTGVTRIRVNLATSELPKRRYHRAERSMDRPVSRRLFPVLRVGRCIVGRFYRLVRNSALEGTVYRIVSVSRDK